MQLRGGKGRGQTGFPLRAECNVNRFRSAVKIAAKQCAQQASADYEPLPVTRKAQSPGALQLIGRKELGVALECRPCSLASAHQMWSALSARCGTLRAGLQSVTALLIQPPVPCYRIFRHSCPARETLRSTGPHKKLCTSRSPSSSLKSGRIRSKRIAPIGHTPILNSAWRSISNCPI